MARSFVLPYKLGSGSGKALARALGLRRLNPNIGPLVRSRTVINWGCSRVRRQVNTINLLNNPDNVRLAVDKVLFFNRMGVLGRGIPRFTTDRAQALKWFRKGKTVMARTLIRSSAGRGIVVCHRDTMPETSVPVAPLYTRYVKKTDEYRVHVLDNEVVDVQKKMRKRGVWNGEWMIRTHAHGWVFGRENIAPPQCVVDAARTAVNDLGLTYGAVDIGYNRHYASAVIFEVNTAPGMVNTTLNRVSTAFKRLLRRYDNAA